MISLRASDYYWNSYVAGRDLYTDPLRRPVVGYLVRQPAAGPGCTRWVRQLRDEGRHYAALLRRRRGSGGGGLPTPVSPTASSILSFRRLPKHSS